MKLPTDTIDAAPPAGRIITRGFFVGQSVLIGAILLALLHAPAQLANALLISFRGNTAAHGSEPGQVLTVLLLSGISFLLAIGVFFLFPLIQGGVLGQVRDRLDSPGQPPRRFGTHSRRYYSSLLSSEVIFTLIMIAAIMPLVGVGTIVAVQNATGGVEPPLPAEVERQLLTHPIFLGAMVLLSILASAVGMVYWVANCVVVAEGQSVGASWRRAFEFCRRNVAMVLVVCLINLVAGAVLAPLGMLGQLGVVTNTLALVGLALAYSVLIGYWGVITAGISMSLYLGRRTRSDAHEPAVPVTV